jgi:hypothetical protein
MAKNFSGSITEYAAMDLPHQGEQVPEQEESMDHTAEPSLVGIFLRSKEADAKEAKKQACKIWSIASQSSSGRIQVGYGEVGREVWVEWGSVQETG